MDADAPAAPSAPITQDEKRTMQVDNAIRAIQQKKPVPEIDFTIHTMEDGTQVSTLERVCKGEYRIVPDAVSLVFTEPPFPSSRSASIHSPLVVLSKAMQDADHSCSANV